MLAIILRLFVRKQQSTPPEMVEAYKAFADAVNGLHAAQRFFDNAEPSEVALVDEAIHGLNLAMMRVNNTHNHLRKLNCKGADACSVIIA